MIWYWKTMLRKRVIHIFVQPLKIRRFTSLYHFSENYISENLQRNQQKNYISDIFWAFKTNYR